MYPKIFIAALNLSYLGDFYFYVYLFMPVIAMTKAFFPNMQNKLLVKNEQKKVLSTISKSV